MKILKTQRAKTIERNSDSPASFMAIGFGINDTDVCQLSKGNLFKIQMVINYFFIFVTYVFGDFNALIFCEENSVVHTFRNFAEIYTRKRDNNLTVGQMPSMHLGE